MRYRLSRRRWLKTSAAASLAAAAWPYAATQAQAQAPQPAASADRIALLIGNRDYPGGHDLPPIPKNVKSLGDALRQRGFTVTELVDGERSQALQAVEAFGARAQRLPSHGIALFYFGGHGLQVDAENLLLAAHVSPEARTQADVEAIKRGSVVLFGDVMSRLPKRMDGLSVAVIDACRTSVSTSATAGGSNGLNQVEAPPGCLITFSTGAGRPAVAPNSADEMTFYTASLVKLLRQSPDELGFSDLFRLVKTDVQDTMLHHPVQIYRRLAQIPFIAENTRGAFSLGIPALPQLRADGAAAPAASAPASGAASGPLAAEELRKVTASLWPPEIVRLADAFLQRFPDSPLVGAATVAREGAKEAAQLLRRNDIRLYRSSFQPVAEFGPDYAEDIGKAARGDKDAAARIGRRFRSDETSGPVVSKYEGWMQYAAELGNGIASYELALHYRRANQPDPASRWEARARELGYTPPPSLDNVRK